MLVRRELNVRAPFWPVWAGVTIRVNNTFDRMADGIILLI